jgi:hypothetical protein
MTERYFNYIPHPDEPEMSGDRDIGLTSWLDETDRESLKEQVWRIAVRNHLV